MYSDFYVTNNLINVPFGAIEPYIEWRLHPCSFDFGFKKVRRTDPSTKGI
jgi:hypothetical protein